MGPLTLGMHFLLADEHTKAYYLWGVVDPQSPIGTGALDEVRGIN